MEAGMGSLKEAAGNPNAKGRILEVAAEMFSQKGFAATRVDKIALEAGVNKALIYYYFPSKEAILDDLIESFFDRLSAAGMSFVEQSVLKFIQEGRMDIMEGRLEFSSEGDLMAFLGDTKEYYEKIMDELLGQRQTLRIIMLESLSGGKHKSELFRYYKMSEGKLGNPLFMAISNADADFKYGDVVVFNKFFFSTMPLISFVVFCDDYAKISGQDAAALKQYYINSVFTMMAPYIKGKSILFQPDPIM